LIFYNIIENMIGYVNIFVLLIALGQPITVIRSGDNQTSFDQVR